MTETIKITREEIKQAVTELDLRNNPKGYPPEVKELAQMPEIKALALLTMVLGLTFNPEDVIAGQLAICYIVGCKIGRAQATAELTHIKQED